MVFRCPWWGVCGAWAHRCVGETPLLTAASEKTPAGSLEPFPLTFSRVFDSIFIKNSVFLLYSRFNGFDI